MIPASGAAVCRGSPFTGSRHPPGLSFSRGVPGVFAAPASWSGRGCPADAQGGGDEAVASVASREGAPHQPTVIFPSVIGIFGAIDFVVWKAIVRGHPEASKG